MNAALALSVADALRAPDRLPRMALAQWDRLIREARQANLLSRVANDLATRGLLSRVPAAPRAHLEASLVVARAQTDAVRREVDHVRSALFGIDCDIVLLKGAAYVEAGLPAARGRVFSDIDILVPFRELAGVEAALLVHGWATTHHDAYDQKYYRTWMHELPPLRHNIRMTVLDVHHAILPRTARLKPDSAKLIAAALPVAGTERLRVLCPADMVLHSAAHLFHNEELSHGLRDLADLDSLLRHFGQDPDFWEALPGRADELDLGRPLYYALRYASRWMGTPVPHAVLLRARAGRPPGLVGRLMDALYRRALLPVAPTESVYAAALARQSLYVRAHWLRMPPHLVVRHLTTKALRRNKPDAEQPVHQLRIDWHPR